MAIDNYVTFICDKYSDIHRENGYCREEELFGQYLGNEIDKRCSYLTEEFFLDYGFALKFKIGKKTISSLLTVVNDKDKKFAISTTSTLNKFEKFIGIKDDKEHSYINQMLDDILRLDKSISQINWALNVKADLNKDENN